MNTSILKTMNDMITTESNSLMMSTLEIAQLTGKEHKNVLADIRTMVEALNSHGSDFSREIVQTTYVNDRGRTYDCFLLNKEMTICLVAGYSPVLRMAIIKRWTQLEEFVRTDAVKQLAVEANVLTPVQIAKIAAYEQVMEADDTNITLREMAKLYGIAPVKFNELLASWGYIFRQGGKWQPRSGYSATCGNPAYVYFQTKMLNVGGTARVGLWITPQGVAKIGKVLTEAGFQKRVTGQMIASA